MAHERVPERPLLSGRRVWLRPLEDRDLHAYRAGINDTDVGARAGYRIPLSPAMATAWLEKANAAMIEGIGFYFAVCKLGADEFIGTIWLKDIDPVARAAELAVFIDHEHLGQGWGTDAQEAMLAYGFETLGLHRIWLTAFAGNERALQSYERIGFRREGVMRESDVRGGSRVDVVLMAMLAHEWLRDRPGADESGR